MAMQHPRYWRWILDHPDLFPGIAPDPRPDHPEVPAHPTGPGGAQSLSQRELEVLTLVAAGSNDAEIARSLHLSPHTVGTHVRNIRAKLDARDRVHLVVLAHRHGLAG
jgi:DNA-binding CsgD family transcriptional regulator